MIQSPQGQDLSKPTTRAVPGLDQTACKRTITESIAITVKMQIALLCWINSFFLPGGSQELYTCEIDEYISLILKLLYT